MPGLVLTKHDDPEVTLEIDRGDLKEMNKSELVQLCRFIGVRAHRGTNKLMMIKLLQDPNAEWEDDNPIDPLRNKVMNFLRAYLKTLKSQLSLGCDADCYEHHDAQVVLCWMINRDKIEEFNKTRSENGER